MAYYVNKLPCSGNLMAAMIEAQSGYPRETTRQDGWAVMRMTLMSQLGRPRAKASLDTAADAVLLLARERRQKPEVGVVVGAKKKSPFTTLRSFPSTEVHRRVKKKNLGVLVF